jgi:hypothetical protein
LSVPVAEETLQRTTALFIQLTFGYHVTTDEGAAQLTDQGSILQNSTYFGRNLSG